MTPRQRVHQVLIGASQGDAVTGMALALRDGLREHFDSDVYALWRHGPEMERECQSLDDMPLTSGADLLLYHLSIGYQEMHDWLMAREEPLAISYHNVTPSSFYRAHNPDFADDLDLGRKEITELRNRVVLAVADSDFNKTDLVAAGYEHVHVIPAGFSPSRLVEEPYDPYLLASMRSRYPNGYVVAVGQVLPHKRIEQLMQTMHLMNSTFWGNVGLVICGVQRQHGYFQSLLRYRSRCAMVDVHFAGAVSDRELATYVRGASAYLGMSDHEGFCIPPLEAAAMGVPVVIKGAGAIPESIGNGALLLPADAGPVLAAEALNEVLTNAAMRHTLIARGHQRVRELQEQSHVQETIRLIAEVVG